MKKFLLFITFALLAIATNAQISTNTYYDGYWGEWNTWDLVQPYKLNGNYSGFIIYYADDPTLPFYSHPSQYIFKFQIENYVAPTKQQIKEHRKKNEWYVYSGTVEYFVMESEPTIRDILKQYHFPLFDKDTHDKYGNYAVKRVANATIKIAPYKKHPEVYNIWFDDVAIAIQLLDNVHF